LFPDSPIKSSSLALHFKQNPGQESLNHLSKALQRGVQTTSDSVLRMLKKAKKETEPKPSSPNDQGDIS